MATYQDYINAAREAAKAGDELVYLTAVQNARGASDVDGAQWAKDITELNGLRSGQTNAAAEKAYADQVNSGPKGSDGQTAGQRGYYLDQADKDAQIAYLKSQGRSVQTDYGLNFDNLMFKREWDALQASRNAQAEAGIVAGPGTPGGSGGGSGGGGSGGDSGRIPLPGTSYRRGLITPAIDEQAHTVGGNYTSAPIPPLQNGGLNGGLITGALINGDRPVQLNPNGWTGINPMQVQPVLPPAVNAMNITKPGQLRR